MVSLKSKIIISLVATAGVICVTILLLWWYQTVFFGDSLVRYVPSETVVYTHINIRHSVSEFLKPYFLKLDKFFSFQDGGFEAKILPFITESAYLVFIDPVTKQEMEVALIKSKNDINAESRIIEIPLEINLISKKISRNTWAMARSADILEKIQWRHNRTLGLRLKKITNDHYFTFFIHRNWIVKKLKTLQAFPGNMSELFDLYMSRWQPFLYGAIGVSGGKTVISLSDFSYVPKEKHAPILLGTLGDFLAYYEVEDLERILSEFGIIVPEFAMGKRRAGVFVRTDEDKKVSFTFLLDMRVADDEELKKVLAELVSHFIPVKRSFTLPDDTVANEIVSDSSAFSFKYIEDDRGSIVWQLLVNEKPADIYIEKISFKNKQAKVYISRSREDIVKAKESIRRKDTQNFSPPCATNAAAEFLQVKKEALPTFLQSFISSGEYLFVRSNFQGFELKGCQL